jgi:hypothetical protein
MKIVRIVKGEKKIWNLYLTTKGDIKFYASYQSAWKAAARLNQADPSSSWLFEMDNSVGLGWFLFQEEGN